MTWSHLLAASDDSPAGLHAVRTAERLARGAGAKLTVLTVMPSSDGLVPDELRRLEPRVGYGLPAIEIVRAAEQIGADLIVLGRSVTRNGPRSGLGSTADLVARRSRVPCLFIPKEQQSFHHLLVALDGTDRGMTVLDGAQEFVKVQESDLEPIFADASPDSWRREAHTERSLRLIHALEAQRPAPGHPLRVVNGEPVAGIMAAIDPGGDDVLVIGCRRGGPGGVAESTGVGRSLLHTAPCAVLTIPL